MQRNLKRGAGAQRDGAARLAQRLQRIAGDVQQHLFYLIRVMSHFRQTRIVVAHQRDVIRHFQGHQLADALRDLMNALGNMLAGPLRPEQTIPKVILEYRGLAKLKTTYTDKLPLMINPVSGRVHTSYHQAVTATGRLSSSDPNLQNIPVRNDEGRRIRQAFIAPEGYRIVAADYSQIELRIMAHLSQDEGLLKAFAEGKDIHRATASEVFGVPLDKVTGEQRRSAKAINFGLIYGMSAFGLARQLGIPRGEAQRYMDLYFERYPGVLDYMERTRQQASEQGYVSTLDGRRLYLPDVRSSNGMRRKAAERAAINAPMQGTAADIIKRAMIEVDAWLQGQEKPLVRAIMQVHDELVFEVHESVLEEASQRIRQLMEGSMTLAVPLKVDVGVGMNWDEAH